MPHQPAFEDEHLARKRENGTERRYGSQCPTHFKDNSMNRRAYQFAGVGIVLAASTLIGCGKKTEPTTTTTGPTPAFSDPDDPKIIEAKKTVKKNLVQIATWMIDCRASERLSTGIYEAGGKKIGLSWRVAVLKQCGDPNLEALFKEFKLDEPWDSEGNKKLISKMPQVYAAPGQNPADGLTYYRSFVGRETIMPPPPGGQGGQIAPGVRWPLDITDGTSNTVMVAEAAEPVIWTKPDELEFDRQKPLPKLGGLFADGYYLAFADNSARFFQRGILTDETLRAIITPKGGELVSMPDDGLMFPPGPSTRGSRR